MLLVFSIDDLNAWNCCFYFSGLVAVTKKLNRFKEDLIVWNKSTFENVQLHIASLESKLEDLQKRFVYYSSSAGSRDSLNRQEMEVCIELEKWYESSEELFWAQKSRQMWLLQGDRNTAYFHNVVRKRRAHQNKIRRIKDSSDRWVEDYQCIERIALSYFENIFSADDLVIQEDLSDWLNNITIPSIPDSRMRDLIKHVTMEEVKLAIFQLKPFKAPGPDGIPATVYHRYWSFMQTDIFNLVRDFF